MKLGLFGYAGNMGRRYFSILDRMAQGVEIVGVESGDKTDYDFDLAIVATPVDSHFGICVDLISRGVPTLCEKPISKSEVELLTLQDASKRSSTPLYMVNNWSHLCSMPAQTVDSIKIVNHNTGPDGFWDLIQPMFLLKPDAYLEIVPIPVFSVTVNSWRVYNREAFDWSYISMIDAFISGNSGKLWTISDAIVAHTILTTGHDRIRRCH